MSSPAAAIAMGDPPPQATTPAAALPAVTVEAARLAEVQERVPLSGSLVAREIVQVSPLIEGHEILSLGAEPGGRVEKGQELARLSAATLTALLAQASAELQRAAAGVAQAESQIASAEAALTQAVTVLDRARSLRQSGSGTQATLDQAVAAEASAQAAAATAREGLAVARAAEAQARAARDIAQLNLDRTVIVSPVDGRVVSRKAQLGAIGSVAGGPMFTLIADGSIEFEGEVLETALPRLRAGQPVELEVAGVGPVTGRVRQLPAAVDPTTRLGLVRVELPEDPDLLTGLFASGDIIVERREAITVPAAAILADAGGERVQVIAEGVVETRTVVAGLIWQGRREIVTGLAAGESVIARAGAFFRSGDRVKAVAQPPDAAAVPAGGADLAGRQLSADPAGLTVTGGDTPRQTAMPAGPAHAVSGPAGAAQAGERPDDGGDGP